MGLSKLALRLGIDLAGLNHLPDAVAILLDADDNRSTGTLEDLLLEAGATSYPELKAAAEGYVQSVQALSELCPKDVEGFRKPSGLKKATVAAMSSILKPGKAIQVSIQDNRWLEESSLALPRIAEVTRFFRSLLE